MTRRKKLELSKTEIKAVAKTESLDTLTPRPTRVIRWKDQKGNSLSRFLFSDNYPNLPSEQLQDLSFSTSQANLMISVPPEQYWYNNFPQHLSFVESLSVAFQVYANLHNPTKARVQLLVRGCTVFLKWLSTKQDLPIIARISDVSLNVLLQFRSYLYHEHNKERLSQGFHNGSLWSNGFAFVLRYFMKRPSYDFVHPDINLSSFPVFAGSNDYSSTTPYSDLEMFEIIQASDDACKDFEHNWKLMREVEKTCIGSWDNLEDICWTIVNICHQSDIPSLNSSHRAFPYNHIRQHFGLTYKEFHEKYSTESIADLSSSGGCPYTQFKRETFESLSEQAKIVFARAWVRFALKELIEGRREVLNPKAEPDWRKLIKPASAFSRIKARENKKPQDYEKALLMWETAGFRPISFDGGYHHLLSLFVPVIESLYPFHLFIHATSGVNKSVVDTIDREKVYPDIDPNNIVYVGEKTKTGTKTSRYEDIVVPVNELNGIASRIEFVKEITASVVPWISKSHENMSLWAGLQFTNTHIRSLTHRSSQSSWISSSRNFASSKGLYEVTYSSEGEIADILPMTSVKALRIRKTNAFKELADDLPYHLIKAALADKSFDTIFKHYIDSDIQRRINFRAIAVIQEALMDKMQNYNRLRVFAGEIVYDLSLSDAKNVYSAVFNACNDPYHPRVEGKQPNGCCNASFDLCLGCRNSRVFREHLPAICLRILQYEEKRETSHSVDWDKSFGVYHARANDCLKRYVERGEKYQLHIDEAWVTAKTESGVFLPPLV